MHSFGLSSLGIGLVDHLLRHSNCKHVVDGVSGDGSLSNYLLKQNVGVLSIQHIEDNLVIQNSYKTLRDYDMHCPRAMKKMYKFQTLILNWPDSSGYDISIIKRFKPNFICLIFDLDGVSGSSELRIFLHNSTNFFDHDKVSKYKTIFYCDRKCIHFQTQLSCKIVGVILQRSDLSPPEMCIFENYNSLLLFSPRL